MAGGGSGIDGGLFLENDEKNKNTNGKSEKAQMRSTYERQNKA